MGWISAKLDMHKITELKDETIKLSKMKDERKQRLHRKSVRCWATLSGLITV